MEYEKFVVKSSYPFAPYFVANAVSELFGPGDNGSPDRRPWTLGTRKLTIELLRSGATMLTNLFRLQCCSGHAPDFQAVLTLDREVNSYDPKTACRKFQFGTRIDFGSDCKRSPQESLTETRITFL